MIEQKIFLNGTQYKYQKRYKRESKDKAQRLRAERESSELTLMREQRKGRKLKNSNRAEGIE